MIICYVHATLRKLATTTKTNHDVLFDPGHRLLYAPPSVLSNPLGADNGLVTHPVAAADWAVGGVICSVSGEQYAIESLVVYPISHPVFPGIPDPQHKSGVYNHVLLQLKHDGATNITTARVPFGLLIPLCAAPEGHYGRVRAEYLKASQRIYLNEQHYTVLSAELGYLTRGQSSVITPRQGRLQDALDAHPQQEQATEHQFTTVAISAPEAEELELKPWAEMLDLIVAFEPDEKRRGYYERVRDRLMSVQHHPAHESIISGFISEHYNGYVAPTQLLKKLHTSAPAAAANSTFFMAAAYHIYGWDQRTVEQFVEITNQLTRDTIQLFPTKWADLVKALFADKPDQATEVTKTTPADQE